MKSTDYILFENDIPDWISFQFGAPNSSLLPTNLIELATKTLMQGENAWTALQYGPTLGDKLSRQRLAKFLKEHYKSPVNFNNLCVTSGASQSLANIIGMFTTFETMILVENPTYFIALRVFKELGINENRLQPIDLTDLSTIESAVLQKKTMNSYRFPYLLYLVPTFNNPTGKSLSEESRIRIVELAKANNILVVCDDVYQLLPFNGSAPTRLVAYDTDGSNVISNCSFSKIFAPGCRLGWIEAGNQIINRFATSALHYSGGSPNHYMSKLISELMEQNLLTQHLLKLRNIYSKRCDVMCNTLKKVLPNGCKFDKPNGGYFVWIHVPFKSGVDSQLVMDALNDIGTLVLRKERVSFTPGNMFSVDKSHGNFLRLSFAMYEENDIIIGCERLGNVLKQCVD